MDVEACNLLVGLTAETMKREPQVQFEDLPMTLARLPQPELWSTG